MIRFGLLASGSKGNSILVASPDAKILIDSGLSYKRLCERVAACGETLDDLKAVFVTHEHSDHVGGVGVLARKLRVPIHMTQGTFENLPESVGDIPDVVFFEAGESLLVDGLSVTSYTVSHDAADPVSFVVESDDCKLAVASDLGYASHLVKNRLSGARALVLESNYCPEMLARGSYPVYIQQRIRSRQGHLSNQDMNVLLAEVLHDGLEYVVAAHVSQENNSRRHVHEMASRVLEDHPAQLFVARQDEPTRMFHLDKR